jgi:hypothetical protein
MTTDTGLPLRELDDDALRRLAIILGDALDAQIENARYLESRGRPNRLAILLRAKKLRDEGKP